MQSRTFRQAKLFALLFGLLAGYAALITHAGGWAVISVEELPDHFVVGKPVTLHFTVRQHGMRLLSDLTPMVQLSSGNEVVAARVKRAGDRYLASFSVPRAGEWRVEINSSFLNNRITLLPLQAIKIESATSLLSAFERGRQLFVAKGCVGCHQHNGVGMAALFPIGPDLSAKRYRAETFKRILENPAVALQTLPNKFSQMPALNLKPAEIEALTTFINTDRQAAVR